MKKLTFPLLLATALVAAGCSSDENVAEIDNSQRSAIELSGTHSVSRAGFTEANTTLKLHYVSTKTDAGFADGADKGATLYMTSSATAAIDGTNTAESVSEVTQTTGADGQKRYWDDVHGRNSNLSIYSIAVPNKTSISKNATAFNAWDTNVKEGSATAVANTIAWEVSATQTLATIADEDLAYSNNVTAENSNTLVYDATTKKFEKAEGTKNIEFNHALSRFTINIKKGDGFGDFGTEFNATSVKFTGFKVKGTLDVAAGTITPATETTAVETVGSQAVLKDAESNQIGYTYVAQVFPGTTIKDVATPMLTITVDGNVYPITGAQIYKALTDNAENSSIVSELTSIKPGKNYNLTINLKKVGIDILSATLVDWNDITAEPLEMDNSHLTFSFYNNNNPCSDVNLYKYEQVLTDIVTTNSNYSAAPEAGKKYTEVELTSTTAPYTTNEYYKDNKTAYHFRSLNNAAETALNGDKTEFTMTSGSTDYHWGAPMLPTDLTSIPYSNTEGYKANIAKGIVAASKESKIVLTEMHMMSDIIVKLETTTGDDKVDLSNAKVTITSASKTGTVDMGLGLITPATEYNDLSMIKDGNTFNLSVIPQLLSRSATAKVGLTIDTDNDRYFVDLSAIKATSVGSQVTNMQTVNEKITQWYPGHKYTYTFTLKKSGITVKATLVDWNTVSTPNTDIWM